MKIKIVSYDDFVSDDPFTISSALDLEWILASEYYSEMCVLFTKYLDDRNPVRIEGIDVNASDALAMVHYDYFSGLRKEYIKTYSENVFQSLKKMDSHIDEILNICVQKEDD